MARPSLHGVRIHVMLSKSQEQALRRQSLKTGLSLAEHIRRALDLYLAHAAEKMSRKP